MSNVRNLVRDLLNDTTVREKKPVTVVPEAPRPRIPSKPPKPVVDGITYGQNDPVFRPAAEPVQYKERRQDPTAPAPLDPDCVHQWSWKDGKKFCWLCDGDAPEDRRDRSTAWQGKVYGKK